MRVTWATVSTHCSICGANLLWDDATWVTAYPDIAHERCIDWSTRSFPYAWRAAAYQSAAHRLRTAGYEAASGKCFAAAQWLLAQERFWPADALAVLKKSSRLHRRLLAQLQEQDVPPAHYQKLR